LSGETSRYLGHPQANLTQIYIEALLVDEELADQVWEAWFAGAISTGQRNTGVKLLCRVSNSRILQGCSLSWRATLVQVSWRIP